MGYAHVNGTERSVGGSRRNDNEARVIAEWIKKNESKLIQGADNDKKIEDIVAIITPFTAQKQAILEKLDEKYKKITVGTVHALQGSERDVILFSSVYTSTGNSTSYFFDAGVNMLNVAVSRAKQSFLVFGDMKIFKENGNKPSNLLAKYLYGCEKNELTDILPIEHDKY